MTCRHLLSALIFLSIATAATAGSDPPSIYLETGDWRVYGDGPSWVDTGLGAFDTDEDASAAVKIEWRGGDKGRFIGPAAGVLANTDGGIFGYGGLYADIAWKRLVITPFWGAGLYEEGNGKDLGGVFQFRSAITLAWRFDERSRVGIHYAHVSNADLYDKNPGEQDLFLTYVHPF